MLSDFCSNVCCHPYLYRVFGAFSEIWMIFDDFGVFGDFLFFFSPRKRERKKERKETKKRSGVGGTKFGPVKRLKTSVARSHCCALSVQSACWTLPIPSSFYIASTCQDKGKLKRKWEEDGSDDAKEVIQWWILKKGKKVAIPPVLLGIPWPALRPWRP